jgi:hypothetical protein
MPQLLSQIHRIDRYDHRIGANDGVIGNHELRTVLHVEQHPIAALDATFPLQVTAIASTSRFSSNRRDASRSKQRRWIR